MGTRPSGSGGKRLAKKDQALRWQRFRASRRSGVPSVPAGDIGQGRFGDMAVNARRRRSGAVSRLATAVWAGPGKGSR